MTRYRDIVTGLRQLDLGVSRPVIAHASLKAFGEVPGGAETMLGAMLSVLPGLMMPTFTYNTMLTPETGPEKNGLTYGTSPDQNRMAEFFHRDLPASRMMGVLPETLRKHEGAHRSSHPILSFSGVGVEPVLATQTLEEPLAPIGRLADMNGWVLLMGVDHTANTSIHYAERLAGRKQFVRWALTRQGVRECPGFPGCSDGFEQAAPALAGMTRTVQIGEAILRALPLAEMIPAVVTLLQQDPLALLCDQPDCERCQAVRAEPGNPELEDTSPVDLGLLPN